MQSLLGLVHFQLFARISSSAMMEAAFPAVSSAPPCRLHAPGAGAQPRWHQLRPVGAVCAMGGWRLLQRQRKRFRHAVAEVEMPLESLVEVHGDYVKDSCDQLPCSDGAGAEWIVIK